MKINFTPAIAAGMIGLVTAAQAAPILVSAQSVVEPLAGAPGSASINDGENQIKARGLVEDLFENALKCIGLCPDDVKDVHRFLAAVKYGPDRARVQDIERFVQMGRQLNGYTAEQVSMPIARHEWDDAANLMFGQSQAERLLKYAPPHIKPARPTLPKSMSMP